MLEFGLARPARLQLALDFGPPLTQRRFVGFLPGEGFSEAGEVVGEEPRAGIAHLELDLLRPPGHLGLFAERRQLLAKLPGQVGEPGEVGLHRVELPHRLLPPPAVLEDAGCLLDEAAAFLGRRTEHPVELSLPHDDVHFAPHAGVRQKFLNVKEPAAFRVDRVFRTTGTEQRAGDGDLGILDGQCTVGVVDGQRHLGAAERRPARGSGEDHVLHFSAAEGLGPLFSHHPGECVDHVGLPRTVRSHHSGDAGFEFESRR